MELAASRRIRAHFNATHHFRAACSTAYHDVFGQRASAGVGQYALYTTHGAHSVLGSGRTGLSHSPPRPDWDGYDRALRSVVRVRSSDLTEEIVILNEAEFEELALDVIVEDVFWYLKFDTVSRILTGVAAVGYPDRYGYLEVLFGVFCVSMAALYSVSVRLRALFFLL